MKILFFVRHPLYLRNYESVLRLLADRGHVVHLAFTPMHKEVDDGLAVTLTLDYRSISRSESPARRDWWWPVGDALRSFVDFLRFQHPRFSKAPALVGRAGRRIPWMVRLAFTKIGPLRSRPAIALLTAVARLVERSIPPDSACRRFIGEQAPDLVILTPMVDFLYSQSDFLKAAQALGIPTVLAVASWDNLSNKGLVQPRPDHVLLWNEVQKREAVEMHGLAPVTIQVTGAQLFDHWFEMTPRWSRETFCREVGGLDPGRPIILYLCSSSFICPDEVSFVKRWIGDLRAAPQADLRRAAIVIRPHPAHGAQWRGADLTAWDNVVVWPRGSGVPIDQERKHGYYDSLYHADAVVGINTSGFIEAGIVGRRTLTLRTEEFRATQEGTLHFHYLTEGGLLSFAEDMPAHLAQLAETLGDRDRVRTQVRDFVKDFVRPHGLDQACTPLFVDCLEKIARAKPAKAASMPLWAPLVRAALWPAAAAFVRPHYLTRLRLGTLPGAEGPGMARYCPPRGQTPKQAARRVRQVTRFTMKSLEALARSDSPIIVGPWLSEVGYEILYWIPFLNWASRAYSLDPARFIVVSRGGAAFWYQRIGGRAVDLLEFYSPDEFKALNERRHRDEGLQKQKLLGEVDREIVERVRAHFKLGEVDLLHPSLMYGGVYRYHWSGLSSLDHLFMHARYHPFTLPEPGPIEAQLPEDYFAVRFYARDSFHDTPENRAFIERVIACLRRRSNVVVLDSPFDLDEHRDTTGASPAPNGRNANRIISVAHLMEPANNLEVQSRIIARSRGFVGTYGGLSYIAPFYRRPAISFHRNLGDVLPSHLNTANTVFASFEAPFLVLTPDEMGLMESVL